MNLVVTAPQALQILFNALSSASIYAMLAIGLTIFLGTLRVLNFAQGDFATVGGYAIYGAVTATGWSIYLGLAAGAVAGGVLGALFFVMVLRPLRKAPAINQFLATFALALFLEGLLQWLFTANERAVPGAVGSFAIGGAFLSRGSLANTLIAVILISALFALLQTTNLGRSIRAVAQNPLGATLVGVDTQSIYLIVCVIGGVMSAGAGLVLVSTFLITPTVGFEQIFKAFTVVIVAGLGNLYRVLIVSVLLAVTESATSFLVSDSAGQMAGFIIIAATLLLRPGGLVRGTS